MTSSARTLVLLALTPVSLVFAPASLGAAQSLVGVQSLLGAQPLVDAQSLVDAQPGPPQVAQELAARVADRIAEQWQVAPEAIHVNWGRGAEAIPPVERPVFRILGRGSDGSFAVVFDRAEGGPVAVRVRAGVRDTVMVAARPIDSGSLIGEADLRAEVRLSWGAPRAKRSGRPGPGWEVRRRLETGEVADWPAVLPPPLVRAGEPVRLEWTRGAVTIALTGLALNSARGGETVQARLAGRRGRLTGVATAAGMATLSKGGIR
jgi:flagella basal body P-ring formation protein FlgA